MLLRANIPKHFMRRKRSVQLETPASLHTTLHLSCEEASSIPAVIEVCLIEVHMCVPYKRILWVFFYSRSSTHQEPFQRSGLNAPPKLQECSTHGNYTFWHSPGGGGHMMCDHLDLCRIPPSPYLPWIVYNNKNEVNLAPSRYPRSLPGLGDPKKFSPPLDDPYKRAVRYGRRVCSLGETLHGHLQTQLLAKTRMWLAEYFSFPFFSFLRSCRGVLGANFVSGGSFFSPATPQYIAIEDPRSA